MKNVESSGILRRVALVRTDAPEGRIAFLRSVLRLLLLTLFLAHRFLSLWWRRLVEPSPLVLRLPVDLLYQPRLARETEVLGETLPQSSVVLHKSHITWTGLERGTQGCEAGDYQPELQHGLSWGKQWFNYWSFVTAHRWVTCQTASADLSVTSYNCILWCHNITARRVSISM
jgi:hypothetical protein